MGRLEKTALYAFVIALVVSVGIHLPIWGALGLLAKVWKAEEVREPESVTVEFDLGEPTEPPEEDPEEPAETAESEADAVAAIAREEASAPETRGEEETRRDDAREEEEEEEAEEVVVEVEPAPPPEDRRNLQAVQQRSQNPAAEAPDNARFIAEENSRVEEETVAELRNYQRDDVEQSAGETSDVDTTDALGNDEEEEIADAREMEGSDSRTATEEEARTERPRESPDRPLPSTVARGDTAREGGAEGGSAASGGGERERVIELDDGVGTFRIVVREEQPEGSGPGEGGGDAVAGRGAGERGRGAGAGDPGTERAGDRGRGRGSSSSGPDLRVSWAEFEELYTEEELREERQAWVEERQSRLRGSNRQEEWERFRAAIENFVPNVRPGNQTALNAAASPFANYLAHVHRRIHRQFADNFLRGLPAGGTSPFADRSLNTKLEIIINRDGTVHRIGVVKTSGFLPFDQGAFLAVMRGQPYPEAPSQILSGDGRVYFHWGFYRNERQCGTFNAEPYILPNPPGTPAPGGGPLRDRPERGTVVPRDARPSWGTDRQEAPERPAPAPREDDDSTPNEDGAPPPPAPEEEGALG